MESLINQFGKSEWDKLSEQERQNHLTKMRLLERKLRKEGKYDDVAKLLGDAALNSDLMNVRKVLNSSYFFIVVVVISFLYNITLE